MPMKTAVIALFVSLSFVSALELVLSDGNDSIVCQRSNDTAFQPPFDLPLPKVFEARIEVTDNLRNVTFDAMEYSNMEQTAIHRWKDGSFSMCKYRHQEKKGHVVDGIRCNWTESLPSRCFCPSPSACVTFIPLTSVFDHLRKYGASQATDSPIATTSIPSSHWRTSCWSQQNPNNSLVITASFTHDEYVTVHGERSVPLTITIQSKGDFLDPFGPEIDLRYEITQFRRTIQNKEMFLPPSGIYCPVGRATRPIPDLAKVFTLTMETLLVEKQIISYTHHHYNSEEKIVVFSVPNSRYNPLTMGSFLQSRDQNTGYRIIHDFNTGIQYVIDEHQGNCSVTPIPQTAFDFALDDGMHIRLRHASEILSLNVDSFVYVGERNIRDIPCNVWISEKPENNRGEYITLEIYFTQDNWAIDADGYSQKKVAPVGVTTYVAKSNIAQSFSRHIRTYFFNYKVGLSDWSQFEISPCLDHINRLFLVLTLKISYTKLIQNGLLLVEDGIRRMIAELAGVSPLRVTNIFLISLSSDEVDVWFVLLEQPNVTGKIFSPNPQILLADAHLNLHRYIDNTETEVTLNLGPRKKEKVLIKEGSLDLKSEFLHPKARFQHDIHLIKAGYSAGSMAGLGFSMALLGTCVGVFIGYLLWKRGTSVPYFIHD